MSDNLPDNLPDSLPDSLPDNLPDSLPDNWLATVKLVSWPKLFQDTSSVGDFVHCWMKHAGRNQQPITFGIATKKIGFNSRGFLSDLVHGKKTLSERSFRLLLRRFQDLPPDCQRLFELLAFAENPGPAPSAKVVESVPLLLKKTRQKLRRTAQNSPVKDSAVSLLVDPQFHLCYAALGSPTKPKSFQSVKGATNLPEQQLSELLDRMRSEGFCDVVEGSWYALDSHRIIASLGTPENLKIFLKNWFLALHKFVNSAGVTDQELYNVSTISICGKDKPEIRKRLEKLLDAIIEEFETEEGDEVASLVLSFTGLTPKQWSP